MSKKLRLGLIGTGVAARRLYLPAWPELASKIELVACTNRTRKKAVEYAKLAHIPKVVDSAEALIRLPEVEAVMVSLPIDVQPEVVLAALRAGKPVLSEKPIAASLAEGKRLVAKARRFSVPWLIGENYAFMPHVLRLEGWIRDGALGEVRLSEARQLTVMNRENPYFHTTWRQKPRFSGAFVVDGGVHLAHVVRRCFGMPTELAAATAGLSKDLPPPDTAAAVLRFASGTLGTWASCFDARYDGPMLRVFGTKANAELFGDRVERVDRSGRRRVFRSKTGSFVAQFAHFADVVKRGATPHVSPVEALLDLQLIQTIAAPR